MSANLSPKAVLIDLAGVLHTGDEALPGAVDALARLRQTGVSLRFLTNTTRSPSTTILRKLRGMGFVLEGTEIQTAALAAHTLVRERGLRPHWLIHPDIAEEMGESDPHPDVVVLGDAGHYFSYEALNQAFRLIHGGAAFMAMACNRYFMEPDGLSLDMGAFVRGLEFSTGVQAEVVGKPAKPFFAAALSELGVGPGDAILIGDDLNDDIGGAQASGIQGFLVRSGKFRVEDLEHPHIHPDGVFDDVAAVVDALCKSM